MCKDKLIKNKLNINDNLVANKFFSNNDILKSINENKSVYFNDIITINK